MTFLLQTRITKGRFSKEKRDKAIKKLEKAIKDLFPFETESVRVEFYKLNTFLSGSDTGKGDE